MKSILSSYYGGKSNISKWICSYIPEHYVYCEPFAGGASVFFEKPLSSINILNDKSALIEQFYKVISNCPNEFITCCKKLLVSERNYYIANNIIKKGSIETAVDAAFYWFFIHVSFSGKIGGGFSFSKKVNIAGNIHNKKARLEEQVDKLQHCTVHNRDAINVIDMYDQENTLFYIDPPYINSDQGHYKGYTEKDFNNLIDVLLKIKGKFILSGYEKSMQKYIENHNFNFVCKEIVKSANRKKREIEQEVLMMNFKLKQNRFNF